MAEETVIMVDVETLKELLQTKLEKCSKIREEVAKENIQNRKKARELREAFVAEALKHVSEYNNYYRMEVNNFMEINYFKLWKSWKEKWGKGISVEGVVPIETWNYCNFDVFCSVFRYNKFLLPIKLVYPLLFLDFVPWLKQAYGIKYATQTYLYKYLKSHFWGDSEFLLEPEEWLKTEIERLSVLVNLQIPECEVDYFAFEFCSRYYDIETNTII